MELRRVVPIGFVLLSSLFLMGNMPHPSAPCGGKQRGDACSYGYGGCFKPAQACYPAPAWESAGGDGSDWLWCMSEEGNRETRAEEAQRGLTVRDDSWQPNPPNLAPVQPGGATGTSSQP